MHTQFVGLMEPKGLMTVNFSFCWSFIYSSIFTLIEETSFSSILHTGCCNPSALSLPNSHIFDKPEV